MRTLFSLAALALLSFAPTLASASQCPAGSYSSTGQGPSCTACAAGFYQNALGQTSCLAAQSGNFALGPGSGGTGATAQTACSQGTYQPNTGQSSCLPCPAGSYCNGVGRHTPDPCPPGRYSDTLGTGQECPLCPAGQFQPNSGQTSCCLCCAGTFQSQTGQPHCQNCPVTGSGSPMGATDQSQCGKTNQGFSNTCSLTDNGQCPNGGSSTGHWRRRPVRRDVCPRGHKSCPVYGSASGRGFLRSFECVDVRNDLESCGGCVYDDSPFGERSADGGRDCSAIPFVDAVTCRAGKCVVGKCRAGYSPSPDKSGCVATLSASEQENMSPWRRGLSLVA